MFIVALSGRTSGRKHAVAVTSSPARRLATYRRLRDVIT